MTYDFRELTLFRIEGGIQQQAGHANDPIHGGTYLMAHGGEKGRFRAVRIFGLLPGVIEFCSLGMQFLGVGLQLQQQITGLAD